MAVALALMLRKELALCCAISPTMLLISNGMLQRAIALA